MILNELAARVKELEGARRIVERELAALKNRQVSMERLGRDKNLLLDHYAGVAPETLLLSHPRGATESTSWFGSNLQPPLTATCS
jgi:hypothetical protein